MYTGSCLCGAVRFEVAGPFQLMAHCHCSMCRKHHGAMFATWVTAPLPGFRWTAGRDAVAVYPSSEQGRRSFCPVCGSVCPMVLEEAGLAALPAGNLDGDPGIRPQMHLFAASAAAGFPITDGLPQHAAYPPEFGGGAGVERPAPEPKPGIAQGRCLCDAVAWEFDGEPAFIQNCHCSRCRKGRSAAHATNAFYKGPQLRWVRGREQVQSWKLPGAKYFGQDFCRRCGSLVPRLVAETGNVVAPCGGFDGAIPGKPLGHVFAGSKADWFEISDGLPQWEAYPPRA